MFSTIADWLILDYLRKNRSTECSSSSSYSSISSHVLIVIIASCFCVCLFLTFCSFIVIFGICWDTVISVSQAFDMVRLQRILPPKMPFFVHRKCKFRHKFRILPVFRHPKIRSFQQCITVTAVNLFYEVLPKQFEAFGFYCSQEKNRWLLNIGYPEQLLFLHGITLWVGRSLIIIL